MLNRLVNSQDGVTFHVKRKVVRAGERPITVQAMERFGTCMLAEVPRQLIRAGKSPVAAFPVAGVRFFPGVGTLVSLEVRRFRVDLVTALEVAAMGSSPLHAFSWNAAPAFLRRNGSRRRRR